MANKSSGISRKVCIFRDGSFRQTEREVADEVRAEIYVDGKHAACLSCSPWSIRQAAIGHLFTEGIADVSKICIVEEDTETHRISIEQGAEGTFLPQSPSLPASSLRCADILRLAAELEERSAMFHRTGGVHSAALSRGDGFLAYEEDISRHTAVDKLAGACLEQGVSMTGAILVFSGRAPGEIIRKAAAMGCCAVIARSAPTDEGCRVADAAGITLIAFAREDGFNVYTHPERIPEYDL